MKHILLILMGFLLSTGYAFADAYEKYIPDSAKQYIPNFSNDETSSSPQETADFKKYIPEPYQKYIPEFTAEQEAMDGSSWKDNWNEETPSSSPQSSLKDKILYGPSSLSNASYHNLIVNGPLKLTHVTVEHSLEVNGPLTGSQIQAALLEVNGPVNVLSLNVGKAVIRGAANLKDAHVKNEFTVYGFLSAQKSIFKKPLHVFSSEIRLKDSQVQAIILERDNSSSNETPRIHLLGATQVFGDIEFKGKKGIVEAGSDVKLDGKVINGILQNKIKDNSALNSRL
ncbi:MAG: hypothetical protein K2Y08_00510 [Alphaproteobacteria bacterium]|nr:hypothetical protein [Alphaproteobacteria bacterium]